MMQRLFLRLALAFATLACLACLPSAASAGETVIKDEEVFAFKGTATDIGVQRGPGQVGGIEYRVEGKFLYTGPLDLTTSTLTFHNLLDEEDGNGEMLLTTDNAVLVCPRDPEDPQDPPVPECELIPGVSMPTLLSSSSSKRVEAKYETPGRFRPPVRVQIKNKSGEYQFNVRLDRGTSPQVQFPGEPVHEHLLPPERQFPQLCVEDPDDHRRKTNLRTSFTIADNANNVVVIDVVKAWECSQPGRYHLRSR